MTFEKNIFITPDDISSIRFQCKNCKASKSIPLEKLGTGNVSALLTNPCSCCDTKFNFHDGTNELGQFVQLNSLLSRLKDMLKGRNLEYGFEIKCDGE